LIVLRHKTGRHPGIEERDIRDPAGQKCGGFRTSSSLTLRNDELIETCVTDVTP